MKQKTVSRPADLAVRGNLGKVGWVRYRMAIFDFDGTLADSFPWFLGVFDELAGEFKLPRRTREEYEAARAFDTAGIVKAIGLPMWKLPRFVARLRALAARDCDRIPLFDGVGEMLRELSAGMEVGIVSSNGREVVEKVFGRHGAAEAVRHYACGASLFGKASKLRGVLRRTGMAGAEAIYIGDEVRDAAAAREAGMDFGAVAWGYAGPAALRGQEPAAWFESVAAIGGTLLRDGG